MRARPPLHCSVRQYAPQSIWLPDRRGALLYYVDTTSARAPLLRAMRGAKGWVVLDLGRIAPELREELPGAPARDVPSLVLHALRRACATAEQLLQQANAAADLDLTRLANAAAATSQEATC